MQALKNLLLRAASHDAAGLGAAALVAGLFTLAGQAAGSRTLIALGILAGTALALASLRHLWLLAQTRRALPPPGKMVDLGGYRVHLLAEGEARDGRPPVVWFAGGHASGYAIHHLHRALRGETRSILIDRPGTGWSDTGPFPRSTAREAEEMLLALERAGERGPFVLASHSFGGLLAANMARRRPDLVHTLVLLDPTPLETIVFGPRLSALKDMQRQALWGGVACWFGIDLQARSEAKSRRIAVYARALDAVQATLGAEALAVRRVEANAGRYFAAWSIYQELSPEGVAACAWDTVVYDRDLGDLPLWLVGPKDDADADISSLPESQTAGQTEAQRMLRFYAATRERYLAASTRSRRVVAPAGSGHNFVFEEPDFTIGVMRGLIVAASAPCPPGAP